MKTTIAALIIHIHKLEEEATAKGWILKKKGSGSVPATKCPKCGKPTVITFHKSDNSGTYFMDVCAHNKTGQCNMIFKIYVRKDKFKGIHAANTYIKYGDITVPDGLNVLQYR